VGELDRSRLFEPSPLTFRESAHERGEARFTVLTVKPSLVPSLEINLHQEDKEAAQRASLETHTSNFSVGSAWLVFQNEIFFKQREIKRIPKKASQRWIELGF
jgi:hypothetical protein